MLIPYTTNAQVRAVFGVTEEELLDETLDLPLYEANLRLELRGVGAALPADYVTESQKPAASLTDAQKDFVDGVTLFAPYVVGLQLTGLPLLAAKAVTDGKAGVTRHSESPFEEQIQKCKRKYEVYRQNLLRVYAAYKALSAPVDIKLPTLFSISTPDSDPVVGT